MSYERLIHDYLDGQLDETGEEVLFSHLSTDEVLRSELNRQKRLHTIAHKDMMQISVPSDVTSGVFGKLGFAVPSAIIHSSAKPKSVAKSLSFFLLLLLLAGTGVSLFLMNENDSLKKQLAQSKNKKSSAAVMTSEEIASNTIDEGNYGASTHSDFSSSANKLSNSVQGKLSSESERANYRNSYTAKSDIKQGLINYKNGKSNPDNISDNVLKDSDIGANRVVDIELSSALLNEKLVEGNSIQSDFSTTGFTGSNRMGPFSNYFYNSGNLYNLNLPNWSLQIRRMSTEKNYPPPTLTLESGTFQDYSIGFWFHYSQDISFGLEAGQEMFTQEFSKNNLNYIQAPVIFWSGASARYQPAEFLLPYTLNPYVVQTVAYTSIGPLLKTQGGITFTPVNQVSFFVGMEYSILHYSPGGSFYNSTKFGWTGGMSVNLR